MCVSVTLELVAFIATNHEIVIRGLPPKGAGYDVVEGAVFVVQ
jgi:hypothetical protein